MSKAPPGKPPVGKAPPKKVGPRPAPTKAGAPGKDTAPGKATGPAASGALAAAVAEAVAAVQPAPAAQQPNRFLSRVAAVLVLIALIGGGGYLVWWQFFASDQIIIISGTNTGGVVIPVNKQRKPHNMIAHTETASLPWLRSIKSIEEAEVPASSLPWLNAIAQPAEAALRGASLPLFPQHNNVNRPIAVELSPAEVPWHRGRAESLSAAQMREELAAAPEPAPRLPSAARLGPIEFVEASMPWAQDAAQPAPAFVSIAYLPASVRAGAARVPVTPTTHRVKLPASQRVKVPASQRVRNLAPPASGPAATTTRSEH